MDELDEVIKAIQEINNQRDSKKTNAYNETIEVLTNFFEEEKGRFFYPEIEQTSFKLEEEEEPKKEIKKEVEWPITPRPQRELFPKKEERNYVSSLSRSYNSMIRGFSIQHNPVNEPAYSGRLPFMRSSSIGYN